jgi:hypothetical protein
MADPASSVPLPLRADVLVVAQPRRTLVQRDDLQAHPPRRLQERPELIDAIYEYADNHNADPKPFVWTASADEIIAKVSRCKPL